VRLARGIEVEILFVPLLQKDCNAKPAPPAGGRAQIKNQNFLTMTFELTN
jgi:hypothetical protein